MGIDAALLDEALALRHAGVAGTELVAAPMVPHLVGAHIGPLAAPFLDRPIFAPGKGEELRRLSPRVKK